VLDPSLLDVVPVSSGLHDDGILLVNSPSHPKEIREKLKRNGGIVASVPATAIAQAHLGRPVANTAMLGAFISITRILDLEEVLRHVQLKFADVYPPAVVEGNLKAMREAHDRVIRG
jgi:pyruvate ferredoxin oxidoreductase gamma subunit